MARNYVWVIETFDRVEDDFGWWPGYPEIENNGVDPSEGENRGMVVGFLTKKGAEDQIRHWKKNCPIDLFDKPAYRFRIRKYEGG